MRAIAHSRWLTLVGLVIAQGLALPQINQPAETLVVSGHSGQAPVTRINGGSYVAVDALARLMSGSLAYQGSQIVLTVPGGRCPSFRRSARKSRVLQGLSKSLDRNHE